MLNQDEFTKRLEQLFEFYELTPSSFADKIGIQRSSVSHLLSGRNKPSLDFVLKVQNSFHDIDLNWLLHGKGNMVESVTSTTPLLETLSNQSTVPASALEKVNTIDDETKAEENKNQNNSDSSQDITSAILPENNSNLEIDKIVIFYKNGTFKSFKPE